MGPCRGERTVVGAHVPNGFGEFACHFDASHHLQEKRTRGALTARPLFWRMDNRHRRRRGGRRRSHVRQTSTGPGEPGSGLFKPGSGTRAIGDDCQHSEPILLCAGGNTGPLIGAQLFNADAYEGSLPWRPGLGVHGVVRSARAAPGSAKVTGSCLGGGNIPGYFCRRRPEWTCPLQFRQWRAHSPADHRAIEWRGSVPKLDGRR